VNGGVRERPTSALDRGDGGTKGGPGGEMTLYLCKL